MTVTLGTWAAISSEDSFSAAVNSRMELKVQSTVKCFKVVLKSKAVLPWPGLPGSRSASTEPCCTTW